MTDSERIDELQQIVNKLLIEISLVKGENITLTQMVLGVYKETLDENSFYNIAERYISQLEETQYNIIDDLNDVLIPTSDHSELIRKKFTLSSNYQQLRNIYLKKN